jgi:hypothetical protein
MRRSKVVCVVFATLCASVAGGVEQKATNAGFTISIDQAQWQKWGFQYPVTYIFDVQDAAPKARVSRRDRGTDPWSPLETRTAADFFNGIECARFDRQAGKAYVSVGFGNAPTIELQFEDVGAVRFLSTAKYYDNRQAAYTLSNDNWGCNPWANPGAPWKGETDDASDNYQAALHVCRSFHLPLSIAINSRSAGGETTWQRMQEELDREDNSWEPAVHGQTHPRDANQYSARGYQAEIFGCRDDILQHLNKIPYGGRIYEHILTTGYVDEKILRLDSGEFLFVRGFNWLDNPTSIALVPWNGQRRFYGVGGLNTKGYDRILEQREPHGRYSAADVADLNKRFDEVVEAGGVFYALWHPDRFKNSVIYDPRAGIDGQQGSTLMQHLAHVANRKNLWYVANGWMYSYRYVAERARVTPAGPSQ